MPVPKRHKSKSKSRMQRAANMKLTLVEHARCPKCSTPKLPHFLCSQCGTYGKSQRQVVEAVSNGF